jgi:large subunit ribosomal protein L24
MVAHFSKELKKQYNRRGFPVRKGDSVTVMRGKFKKRSGKIARINTDKYRVYIEGIMIKRTDGTERQAGTHPSNLRITKLNLDDKKRVASLTRKTGKKIVVKKEEPKKPAPKKKPEAKKKGEKK